MTDPSDQRSPWNEDGREPGDGPNSEGGSSGLLWGIAAALALVVAVVWVSTRYSDVLAEDDNRIRFIYLCIFLVVACLGVMATRRFRLGVVAKQIMGWVGIVSVLALGYAYRDELKGVKDRLAGEILPHEGTAGRSGEIAFRRGANEHFQIVVTVDGTPVRFMVDTGASDVVLSPRDAKRIGLDPSRLVFDRVYATANGSVKGAPVRIGEMRVGPIRLRDVRASVNGAPMRQSLLGLSFLNRLKGFDVRGNTLTLRP